MEKKIIWYSALMASLVPSVLVQSSKTPAKKTPAKKKPPKNSKQKKSPSKSSPVRTSHYEDDHSHWFYVGGVLLVTHHPIHGPSLVVFHNPTRFNPKNRSKPGSWESPQGKYEQHHNHILETCRAELFEETAGIIDVTTEYLATCRYIDLPNSSVKGRNSFKRFYVLRIDHASLFSPEVMFETNRKVFQTLSSDKTFSRDNHVECFLEMDKVGFLPLTTIRQAKWPIVSEKTFEQQCGGKKSDSYATLHGHRGVDKGVGVRGNKKGKKFVPMLLFLLKATLVARGIDALTGEPNKWTGLELACSAFECYNDKEAEEESKVQHEGGSCSAGVVAHDVSVGPCQRALGGRSLSSLGLRSIRVECALSRSDSREEESKGMTTGVAAIAVGSSASSSSASSSSARKRLCQLCNQEKLKPSFSQTQWRKHDSVQSKCKECVAKERQDREARKTKARGSATVGSTVATVSEGESKQGAPETDEEAERKKYSSNFYKDVLGNGLLLLGSKVQHQRQMLKTTNKIEEVQLQRSMVKAQLELDANYAYG